MAVGFSQASFASTSGISYQGRIVAPDGRPISGQYTQFRLQIRTPDAQNCLLYEELQTVDLRDSNGVFALTMNDGNGARVDSTGLTLDRLFANRGTFNLNPANCLSGTGVYLPNSSDGRILSVQFKDETMSTWEPIPSQKINFVPFAFESKQVSGFTADSLVRVVNGSGDPITGLAPLSNTQYTELLALINGTTTQFEKAGRLGGITLPTLGAGQAGQVLSWTGTGWTTTTAGSGTVGADAVSSSNIVNGSITGADLATNIAISTTANIVSSGTVSSNITTARDFRIYDSDTTPNENYISIKTPTSLAANYNYVWPIDYGTANQVLTTDGTGALTWAAPAVSSQWINGPANAIGYLAGNVGIGTTVPDSKLKLEDSTAQVTLDITKNSFGGFHLTRDAAGSIIGSYSGTAGRRDITLKTGSSGSPTTRIFIDGETGNVGIGTTAPTAALHLKAGTTAIAPLKFTAGVNRTASEDGEMEYDGAGLWFTIGTTRYLIPINTAAGNYSNVQTISNSGGSINITPAAGNSLIVNQSTLSTSPTTGALIVNGGAGIAGAVNAGGNISSGGTVSATNSMITPQIYGSSAASGNIKIDGTSDATKGYVLLASTGGRVGIGTTAPSDSLVVEGSSNGSGAGHVIIKNLFDGNAAVGSVQAKNANNVSTEMGTAAALYTSATAIPAGGGFLRTGSSNGLSIVTQIASAPIRFATGGEAASNERVRIDGSGNVGIGTTSPQAALDVGSGNIVTTGKITYPGASTGLSFDSNGRGEFSGMSGTAVQLTINNTATSVGSARSLKFDSGGSTQGSIGSTIDSTGNSRMTFSTNTGGTMSNKMTILPDGNVGIGTTSPQAALDVGSGNIVTAGTITYPGASTGLSFDSVGRATFASSSASSSGVAIANTASTTGSSSSLMFKNSSVTGAQINSEILSASGQNDALEFFTRGSNVLAERMRIDASGNVGIGTTNPGFKLDVAGDVNVTGNFKVNGVNIAAGGGDFKSDGSVAMTGTLIAKDGTAASPSVGFTSEPTTGLYRAAASQLGIAVGGAASFKFLGASGAYMSGGRIRGATGAANSPTYGFENDLTSGLYGGGGTIGLSVGNTARLSIDAAGQVGIGTTAPGMPLDVVGNIRSTSGLYLGSAQSLLTSGAGYEMSLTNGYSNGIITFQGHNGTSVQERVRITGAGNVGIGTTAPNAKLEIAGYSTGVPTAPLLLVGSDLNYSGYMSLFGRAYMGYDASSGNLILQGVSSKGIRLNVSNNTFGSGTALAIDTTGNVGIGTTAPAYKLDVVGSVNATQLLVNGTDVSSTASAWSINGSNVYRSSGNVGVGTSTPSTLLHIRKGAGTANVRLESTTGRTYDLSSDTTGLFRIVDNGSSNNFVFEGSTGSVGIGTSAPQTKLSVAGIISPATDASYSLGNATYRFTDIYATGSVVSTSDGRLKTDVRDSDLGLDFINRLRPVSFKWKQGEQTVHYGVIAQETEAAVRTSKQAAGRGEEAKGVIVAKDQKIDRYGVKYTELIAPLIKAVQELYAKLFEHDRRIASVEQKLAEAEIKHQNEMNALKEEMALLKSQLMRVERSQKSK